MELRLEEMRNVHPDLVTQVLQVDELIIGSDPKGGITELYRPGFSKTLDLI